MWPSLDVASWAPTKRTIHLVSQMLGKIRLALAPHQPNFIFTALLLTPRGFTTAPIPVGSRLIELQLDVFDARIRLASSDGREGEVCVAGAPTIATIFEDVRAASRALGAAAPLCAIPQEIADTTPLDRDEREPTWVPEDARRWHAITAATQAVFDRWRAHFFGRTALQLWWGAFDLSLMLFSGKHAEPPAGAGYLLKYDLDAEMMNVRFYPGDDASAPFFFGYVYPQPAGAANYPIRPTGAQWSERLREWVYPYDVMRSSHDPEASLAQFLDSVYAATPWDRQHYTYTPPPLRHGAV